MTPGPATRSGAPDPGARAPRRFGRGLEIVFAVVAVLAIAGIVFVSSAPRTPASAAGRAAVNASAADAGSSSVAGTAAKTAGTATAAPPRGMARISLASLPREARDVVARIDRGGAFPFRQDGATFANRERRLPAEPRGYYREYTVDTPGSSDRGPRRVILGRGGELYYTADHYRTFQWIVRNGATP